MIKTEVIKEQIVEREYTAIKEKTCDVCGVDIDIDKEDAGYGYSSMRNTVKQVYGYCWPEDDNRHVVEFDLCGWCFDEHVANHLRSIGANPREVYVDDKINYLNSE